MKWKVMYAVERVVEIDADNINAVYEEAKLGLRPGEQIVSMRVKR